MSDEPTTIWSALQRITSVRTDGEAVVSINDDGLECRISFVDMLKRSRKAASYFLSHGILRGDRVAIWMTNSPEWLYVYLGLLSLGAIAVPVNTWLGEDEVRYVLRQSESRHLVLLDRFRKLDFLAAFQSICPEWSSARYGRLCSDALPDLRTVFVMPRDSFPTFAAGHAFDLREFLLSDDGEDEELRKTQEEVRPRDIAAILYTSGSTSFPKGAMLEQADMIENGFRHSRRLGIEKQDRFFSPRPFFHGAGSIWGLMTMVAVGCTLVFTEAFDPHHSLRLIERERCTINFPSGAGLRDQLMALEEQTYDLSSLRLCFVFDSSDVDRVLQHMGVQMAFIPYGLIEAYGAVSLAGRDDSVDIQMNTNGRPLDGIDLKVVIPGTNDEVAPNTVGELMIHGAVMRGYFNMPEQTAAAMGEDGWLRTGDVGVINEAGYVRFVGRIKAMVKVGGENVAVEEVEDCIRRYPGVVECVVVGVPDARKIEVPRAYVVARSESVTAATLTSWCVSHLASFKVPREIILVPDLPRTGSGKVARAEIEAWDFPNL